MLRLLSIRNFAIVDCLELEFGPGFTVLTGETGAGKSILVDALSLALGGRADGAVVRAGQSRAEVIAEFDLSRLPGVVGWLEENGLEGGAEACLLRRMVDSSGRSRGFVNGRPVPLQQLRELGERLVDIHGQHAHQSLLRLETQRALLDAYAGALTLGLEVEAAYRRWRALRERCLNWERDWAAAAREREELQWQLRELKALGFSVEEWRELQADHARLAHIASLVEGAEFSLECLSEGDGASLARLNAVISRLSALLAYDARLKDVLDLLQPAQVQLQEAAYGLRHYRQGLDLDPGRLRQVESRLEAIHNAARKYRVVPEELPALEQRLRSRLEALPGEESRESLAREEQAAREAYLEAAGRLSSARAAAGKALAQQVTELMQSLAMEGGRFSVALPELPEGGVHGLERVEFQVSGHATAPLYPLARVASGGELSRIGLAIQVAASRVAAVPTLIFDEVDAGIGGRVAEVVGRMMKKLGQDHQVMCVTHLPQVAAWGDHQWQVVKAACDGEVLSRVRSLSDGERVEEIARMLGGVRITETTRKHAAEMLNGAKP